MYPQHMFWLRNKKNNFQISTLIWRPEIMISWHSIASFWASQSWKAEPDHLIMCTQVGLRLPRSTIRGQKFHSSARNNECNLERLSNSSQSTHPVGRYRTSALERITHGSQITYYSLMFFIAYTFKGQVHVFARQGIIVSHLSFRTSVIFKIFLSPDYTLTSISTKFS